MASQTYSSLHNAESHLVYQELFELHLSLKLKEKQEVSYLSFKKLQSSKKQKLEEVDDNLEQSSCRICCPRSAA